MHVKSTKLKVILLGAGSLLVSACMSTAPALGPAATAWSNYLSWYKVTPEPTTGDPTGRLTGVHDGINAYRAIYINSTGEAVNRGNHTFPYPAGTILVKESFNNLAALEARRSPDLTIMVKLQAGQSPQTADWEYVMGLTVVGAAPVIPVSASFASNAMPTPRQQILTLLIPGSINQTASSRIVSYPFVGNRIVS